MRTFDFDVMSKGVFLGSFKMPLTLDLITTYIDDMPVYDYEKLNERARAFAEEKKPSLRYRDYKIMV